MLQRLQRLAMVSTTHTLRGTPTEGMELALGLEPLDLFIQAEAVLAAERIRGRNATLWDGIGGGNKRSHLFHTTEWKKACGLRNTTIDKTPSKCLWTKPYSVEESKTAPNNIEGLTCQVNCSKQEGLIQWRASVSGDHHVTHTEGGIMNRGASSLQTELFAMGRCAKLMLHGARCTFLTRNPMVAKTLLAVWQGSIIALDCIEELRTLSRHSRVVILHCPNLPTAWPHATIKPFNIPIPPERFRARLWEKVDQTWTRDWKQTTTCRQTKLWFAHVNRKASQILTQQNRRRLSHLIQVVTGHSYLFYHAHIQGKIRSTRCRFCFVTDETAWHIFVECPHFSEERQEANLPPAEEINRNGASAMRALMKMLESSDDISALLDPQPL